MLWTRFCWSQQWSRTSCLQAATFSCWSSSASAHTTSSRCVHKAQTHTRTWMHACTQTFTCSGVLVCELGTADIRKRNQRRNRFMLQNPHQVNENLVITLMCERYGPLRNSCSVWSYLPVISGEFFTNESPYLGLNSLHRSFYTFPKSLSKLSSISCVSFQFSFITIDFLLFFPSENENIMCKNCELLQLLHPNYTLQLHVITHPNRIE